MGKKFFITAISLFCILAAAPAHQAAAFDFSLGPKVDLGAGFLTGKYWKDIFVGPGNDNRAVLDFAGGLLLDLNFFRSGIFGLGLQPELLICMSGGGMTAPSGKYLEDYGEVSFKCLEIPIYLKPRIKLGKGDLYLLCGVNLIYLLGPIELTQYVAGKLDPAASLAMDPDTRFLVGIAVGLGYDIDLGAGKLEIGIAYTNSLMEMSDFFGKTYSNRVVLSLGAAIYAVKP